MQLHSFSNFEHINLIFLHEMLPRYTRYLPSNWPPTTLKYSYMYLYFVSDKKKNSNSNSNDAVKGALPNNVYFYFWHFKKMMIIRLLYF